MKISPEIELNQYRCPECGRFYLCERGYDSGCAGCKSDQIEELSREREHLGRVIRGLRGALKQKARRK